MYEFLFQSCYHICCVRHPEFCGTTYCQLAWSEVCNGSRWSNVLVTIVFMSNICTIEEQELMAPMCNMYISQPPCPILSDHVCNNLPCLPGEKLWLFGILSSTPTFGVLSNTFGRLLYMKQVQQILLIVCIILH